MSSFADFSVRIKEERLVTTPANAVSLTQMDGRLLWFLGHAAKRTGPLQEPSVGFEDFRVALREVRFDRCYHARF